MALAVEYELPAAITLQSISTWADSAIEASFDGDWGNDRDWGAAGPYDFYSSTLRDRSSLSQDLRLQSEDSGPWGWIGGLYGLRLEEGNRQLDDGLYLTDRFDRSLTSEYRATTLAAYGEASRRLAAGTTLSAGLRLEQRSAEYRDSDGADYAPRDRMWGGQISLVHELTNSTNAWASLSRGFKAGGFNIGAAVPAERLQFDPEFAWSAEAGIKAIDTARGLSGDVSLFYLRRQAQQVATSVQLDPQDPLTFVFFTDNAARGRAYGLEGSLRWQVGERWQLSSTLSLLDTAYLGYSDGTRELDGREWAHAPRWKYSLAADWRHPAGWMLRVDAGGSAAFYFDVGHDQRSDAYTLINLRGGYERARWSAHVWLRNALDERYAVRGFFFGNEPPIFPAKLYLRLGDPRQLGVTVNWKL